MTKIYSSRLGLLEAGPNLRLSHILRVENDASAVGEADSGRLKVRNSPLSPFPLAMHAACAIGIRMGGLLHGRHQVLNLTCSVMNWMSRAWYLCSRFPRPFSREDFPSQKGIGAQQKRGHYGRGRTI